ncbi:MULTISPECIES: hypothetical protein [Haloarcula]|uniref:hypothetical protein n=1 Tax=Haloarcula TaxID=2237 RepID=UPI0023EC6E9C|nr:hypothetical protein [Halomicroarcula sp. XH51]
MSRPEAAADRFETLRSRVARPGYVELVFAVVLVWGFGDAVSTLLAADAVGIRHEQNPWLRLLFSIEPLLIPLVKGAVVLLVGVVLLECRDVIESVPLWRAWFAAVILAGTLVVAGNVYVALSTL